MKLNTLSVSTLLILITCVTSSSLQPHAHTHNDNALKAATVGHADGVYAKIKDQDIVNIMAAARPIPASFISNFEGLGKAEAVAAAPAQKTFKLMGVATTPPTADKKNSPAVDLKGFSESKPSGLPSKQYLSAASNDLLAFKVSSSSPSGSQFYVDPLSSVLVEASTKRMLSISRTDTAVLTDKRGEAATGWTVTKDGDLMLSKNRSFYACPDGAGSWVLHIGINDVCSSSSQYMKLVLE